jgi:DNA replication and repair protein RecF
VIQNIHLHHIRPYIHAQATFEPGINILFGPNGAGKTTILESICVLASTKSYRAPRLFDLVTYQHPIGSIQGDTTDADTLKVEILQRKHLFIKNGTRATRTSQYLHPTKIVVLAPEHQFLISGPSEKRRTFLDHLLCQKNPLLLDKFKHYRKTIKQKQALLKQNLPLSEYRDYVQPWNQIIVECGSEIRKARHDLLKKLEPFVQEEYLSIAHTKDRVEMRYIQHEEDMVEKLKEYEIVEYKNKRALVGPHRDDFEIMINHQHARDIASQGERASLLLSLKFAEMDDLSQDSVPTLLLDDVGVTLDESRRSHLFDRIKKLQPQTIITTPDLSIVRSSESIGAKILTQEMGDSKAHIFWK